MKEKSCGVLLYRRGRTGLREYLAVKYVAGHWSFTKGHVEPGESEEETGRREVREETGIKGLRLKKGFCFKARYRFKRGRVPVEKQVVFFLARTSGRVLLTSEHTAYAWLPAAEAAIKLTYASDRQLVESAEAYLAKTA